MYEQGELNDLEIIHNMAALIFAGSVTIHDHVYPFFLNKKVNLICLFLGYSCDKYHVVISILGQ